MAKSKLSLLALALALVAVLMFGSGGASAGSSALPPGLTSHGRLIWQFEALLHDTDGPAPVCEGPHHIVNFVTYPCAPLADYNAYQFTFLHARHSAFTRTATRPPVRLGNVLPVRVGGRYVRCSRKSWLVMLGSGIFPLACVS